MTPNESLALLAAIAAGIAALTAIWKAIKRARAATRGAIVDGVKIRDSIIGRGAVVDTITGQQLAPPLPGIGQRMDTVERTVATLADQHRVLDDHEDRLKAHAEAIAELKAASVERVVTRAESAAAWRAVEAVAMSTPDDPDTDL